MFIINNINYINKKNNQIMSDDEAEMARMRKKRQYETHKKVFKDDNLYDSDSDN